MNRTFKKWIQPLLFVSATPLLVIPLGVKTEVKQKNNTDELMEFYKTVDNKFYLNNRTEIQNAYAKLKSINETETLISNLE
ncbi:hypothetical protein [Mycoplasma hafezii]|uniref:hypothetical protein n=1 Tax=Mycoplasma hafezii TaxID=525886 RepID=UPI003CEC5A39